MGISTGSVFVDRINELKTLEKEYQREDSSLVIIYGRRRTGKTSLINKFMEKHGDCSLYYLATQESDAENRKSFKNQLADFTSNELLKSAEADWITLFRMFATYDFKNKKRKILIIDEFQYIGKANSAFPSIVQKAWDTVMKDSDIMLILCGSLITLMKEQTLDYSSPLYGRRTAQIRLGQIPFKYYRDFFNNKSNDELIPFYAVTGGVPKYIESLRNSDNVFDGIRDNILSRESYLYEEPYFLLQNEVSEIGSYFSLIKAIAMGNRKLSDISAFMGVKQTSLTKYIKILTDLDLLEREVPITEVNPEKSKMGLYKLKDNFIAFWFHFVYPYRSYLDRGEISYTIQQIQKSFIQNYVSYIYEDICREKMWDLNAADTWAFRFNKIGKYWGKLCGETDIVAIDTIGKNMIIGECKYSESEKGLQILHLLEEKGEILKKHTNSEHIYYIIFSNGGFTKGLLEEAERRNDILLQYNL